MGVKPPLVISYLRFSRPEHMRGDCLHRQLDASEKWAAERGMRITDSLRDLGAIGREERVRGANAGDQGGRGALELGGAGERAVGRADGASSPVTGTLLFRCLADVFGLADRISHDAPLAELVYENLRHDRPAVGQRGVVVKRPLGVVD
ncbi:recombinase family protein [Humisphaera borealis]|uniref:Recombinase family protein n=1 Tax=Humisphaera borealis TaxID=2807512 RepID=A0A7M2WPZ6_9BACT|nr:recombinase family protein [Humisphaera borealis]